MPTYEFRCPKGHEFEHFYKTMSTAPSEVKCPECGAVAVRQLSGGGGLVFKGSGFYLTDYGKNAHRGGAAPTPEGAGDSAAASSENPSKESAPASKETASPAKETAVSKESGSTAKSESKPAPLSKPAESKSSSESKPKKSGGSKSKDK